MSACMMVQAKLWKKNRHCKICKLYKRRRRPPRFIKKLTTNQLCPCQHPKCCRFRKSLAMTGLRDLSKKSISIFLIPQALQSLSCFPKLPQQRLHLPPLLLRNSSETDMLWQNWRTPPTSNSRPVKKTDMWRSENHPTWQQKLATLARNRFVFSGTSKDGQCSPLGPSTRPIHPQLTTAGYSPLEGKALLKKKPFIVEAT